MGRPSRRARTVRESNEFNLAQLIGRLMSPTPSVGLYAWDLEKIRAARNAQMAGNFELPVRMAEAMRTDDALFTAYENRLAPQRCIGVKLVAAAKTANAERIRNEAEGLFGAQGIGVTTETLADINGTFANHGLAIGVNTWTPRPDGSRIDVEMKAWPLEWVRWNPTERCLMTRTHNGPEVPIVHGNGRWAVFAKHELEPWKQSACVLPGSFVWARHAYGLGDWSSSSKTHGQAKVVGEMPDGVPLQGDDGGLSSEAQAFLTLLEMLYASDFPVGIRPSGSKTDFVANGSTAWQVFSELVMNAEKGAARIYLGTDGMLGSVGGAPGVDIAALFGVATTKVQGDLGCIERGLFTGVIQPWCAINHGDSTLAPTRDYEMPDADADAESDSYAKRMESFNRDVDKLRANGFTVDQATVNELAKQYRVTAPLLPEESKKAPTITLAPTDIARVVKVNEARASAGLGPLTLADGSADPDGFLTVEEFSAKKTAKQDATAGGTAPTAAPKLPARTNGAASQA